jgi:YihY family inner membrane protein
VTIPSRLDEFQRRHKIIALIVAVMYKFIDDQGYYLAALLAYYGFLSLFPLLLLLVTSLGFVLQGSPAAQQYILHSALTDFPVIGQQLLTNVHSLHGSVGAIIAGGLISIFSGLGVANVGQTAMNRMWAVPRVARPDIFRVYARSALVILILGLGVLLTTALSGLTTVATDLLPGLGIGARLGATALSVVVNVGLFLIGFRVLTARPVSFRQLRPGAIAAAIGWQILQVVGTYLVEHELRGASASYGFFGIVLGLMLWLYLGALVVVLCAEINPVRANKLWPRSLLAPFTATAGLTRADERAYASYAATEQHTSDELIDVRFHEARRRRLGIRRRRRAD